jgi:hypothetical protein
VTLPTPTIEVRVDPSRVIGARTYELTFFGSVEENFEVMLELADGTRVHWDIDHDLENLLLALAVALNERLRLDYRYQLTHRPVVTSLRGGFMDSRTVSGSGAVLLLLQGHRRSHHLETGR